MYYKRIDASGDVLECGEAPFLSTTVTEIAWQEYQDILAAMEMQQAQQEAAQAGA